MSPIASLGRRDWDFDTEDKESKMSERAHCEKHQRYLNKNNACIDCESIELALSYAQDIVNDWPQLTMRQLGEMTKKVNTLRQALEAARK